jgi:phosphoheptose isomerase
VKTVRLSGDCDFRREPHLLRSNDFGYDYVSRYVEAVGREGDVLLGISTSGNSGNVIKAIAAAREKGMKVITLTGKDGGKMAVPRMLKFAFRTWLC